FRARRCMDNQRCENKRRAEPLPEDAWRGSRTLEPDGWTAFAAIPWALVGGAPGPGRTMGFNLLRHRSAGFGASALFNATTQGPHAPWAWADLALGAAEVHVERIDLGELRLWENRGVLSVENRGAEAIVCTLEVTVRSGEREDCLHHRSATPALIPGGSTATALPFAFPLDPEDWKWNRLDLALVDRSGTTLWSATVRFGYGNTWLLHLDDRREGPRASTPIPGAPDFMAAKRRQIMQAQPRFRRITTAQGAASDFTLAAEDGSVRFDLMRAGELQTIADWLYGRYDNDVDRLLGALFFVHQPSVIRYCNAATAIADGLGPLSALRFGAGQCSVHAEALCGILETMRCDASGRTYRTTRVTTHAHVTTLAELEDRWVFLDPSIGRFYFLRDDRTLASLQDLLADPALAARGAKHMDEYLRATNENPDLPNFYRAHATVWPAGAPPE
ncbi:MAG: hypothetical protein H0W83_17820, partial [Planctomycetes bacterium]|nr:hypothetical protein [Planctomycetota bacterium]